MKPSFDPDVKGGDFSYRVLRSDAIVRQLEEHHRSEAFDHAGILRDDNVAFPLDRLRELAATGEIDEVAPRHLSFMGSITAEPRLERGAALEAAETFEDCHPGVLDDLLRHRLVPDEDSREAEQRSAVLPNEPGEGGSVAGADPPDELGVVEPRCMAFGVCARSCRAPHQRRPMSSAFAINGHGKGSEGDHLVPVVNESPHAGVAFVLACELDALRDHRVLHAECARAGASARRGPHHRPRSPRWTPGHRSSKGFVRPLGLGTRAGAPARARGRGALLTQRS